MSWPCSLCSAVFLTLFVPTPLVADDGDELASWSLPPGAKSAAAEEEVASIGLLQPPIGSPVVLQDAQRLDFDPITNQRSPYRFSTFEDEASSVRWEIAGMAAAMTATRFKDVTTGGSDFHFKSEGWFGRSTKTLGMDKLHHAWKTYVVTDVLQTIIARRTGEKRSAATTSALLGTGLMAYAEVLDGFTGRTGFSNEDMVAHMAGASLSLARNRIPGLRNKVDFRMLYLPRRRGNDLRLVNQMAQRKYQVAVQLSGFRRFEDRPLRFVEVHLGYYGRGFTDLEKARGDPLRRRVYVGIGFNVQQLFTAEPKSRVERIARGSLDYVQLPYTSIY